MGEREARRRERTTAARQLAEMSEARRNAYLEAAPAAQEEVKQQRMDAAALVQQSYGLALRAICDKTQKHSAGLAQAARHACREGGLVGQPHEEVGPA